MEHATKSKADTLYAEAFSTQRDPRSPEYKAGVYAALKYRYEAKKIDVPYKLGTASADAFFSGLDEGHNIWRRKLDNEGE